MPLFHRIRQEDGTFVMEEVTGQELEPVVLQRPASATVKAVAKKRFRCSLCKAEFAGQGILSMHFAKNHKDQITDKDSWRKFVENLETTSGPASI